MGTYRTRSYRRVTKRTETYRMGTYHTNALNKKGIYCYICYILVEYIQSIYSINQYIFRDPVASNELIVV
jgi:hypothetical protein